METQQVDRIEEEEIFDLVRHEEKIKLRNQAGEIEIHTLREIDGIGRDKYMDALMSRSKLEVTGKGKKSKSQSSGLTSYEGLESMLISMMLHNSKGERVAAETIQLWPGRTQAKLFEKCQAISGLREEDIEEEKNDSEASD